MVVVENAQALRLMELNTRLVFFFFHVVFIRVKPCFFCIPSSFFKLSKKYDGDRVFFYSLVHDVMDLS